MGALTRRDFLRAAVIGTAAAGLAQLPGSLAPCAHERTYWLPKVGVTCIDCGALVGLAERRIWQVPAGAPVPSSRSAYWDGLKRELDTRWVLATQRDLQGLSLGYALARQVIVSAEAGDPLAIEQAGQLHAALASEQ